MKVPGPTLPPSAVLVKVVDEVAKEKDPEIRGSLACSLAYQHSAAIALVQQGEPQSHFPLETLIFAAKEGLKKLNVRVDLSGFSLEAPPHTLLSGRRTRAFTGVRSMQVRSSLPSG